MLPFKKLLKVSLFPAANIFIGIFLLGAFFTAGRNIVQTFRVADMTALAYLRPNPINYFWELNIHHAPLDTNKVRYYADYYEHLLQVFPGLRDAYGLLGYCYHYLNDDPKAIKFLKMGVGFDPDYFFNYYNLAVIYIKGSRYPEASDVLQKALKVDPMTSLKKMLASTWVYLPLLGPNERETFVISAQHTKEAYQLGFFLKQILGQMEEIRSFEKNKNPLPAKEKTYYATLQDMIRKLHLELYAF